MRIQDVGKRIHVDLKYIVRLNLGDPGQHSLVALAEDITDFVPGFFGQYQAQGVVLDALAP